MSIANRILSVLVLLASIGAIVLAFMLFGAREEVVAGRNDMAQAIADNSNKLAQTSTEDPAKVKITTDEMSVAQGNDSVDGAIRKFDEVTKSIIAQRDMLAEQLVELNKILAEGEASGLTSAELADVKTNAETFATLKKQAEETVQLYVKIREEYVKAVRLFEDALNMQPLGAIDPKNPKFDEINAALTAMDKKIREMMAHIKEINSNVPKDFQVGGSLEAGQYASYLEAQAEQIKKLAEEWQELSDKVKELEKEVTSLKERITELEAEVKQCKADLEAEKAAKAELQKKYDSLENEKLNLEEELAKLKEENKKLKSMGLGSAGGVAVAGTADGTAAAPQLPVQTAALSVVEAKVTHVEPASGFVVLNIGSTTKVDVKDASGNKRKVQLVLPQNAIMTVATSLNPENAKFVCKIQVYKVEANRTFANILTGGNMPKVGDVVFFSATDIVNSTPDEKK